MEGLKATLECIYQINIVMDPYDEEDIWVIEKGEKIDCMICDNGIKLKLDKHCWHTLKPSVLKKYFKVV